MDADPSEHRDRTATILAVTLASTTSAAVSRSLSGGLGLLLTIAIGAAVGLLTRWALHQARLRDHLDGDDQHS
ncbi:hypothetical protein ACWD4P_30975 [Kitasatospora sp. NPDC002543]